MKKNILITGSTDGIGKLAAIRLAKEGHVVYVHGRNPEKLAAVVAEIKQASANETVKGFVADFSDLDSVRQMAQQMNAEVSKIDVLINNAGIFNSAASRNKDGLDIRMVVNYLAPYVLTNALMPLLSRLLMAISSSSLETMTLIPIPILNVVNRSSIGKSNLENISLKIGLTSSREGKELLS